MTSWRKGKSGTPKRNPLPSKPAQSPPAASSAPAPASAPTGKSWKKTGRRPVASSSSEQAKWKERTTKPGRSWRGLKLALGTLVLLGLCLAFFITLYRRPIQTPFIVLGAVEYQDSFPVSSNGGKIRSLYSAVKLPRNLGTAEDLQHLQQTKSGNISVTFVPDRRLSQEQLLNQLKTALSRSTPGGPGKNVLMAYLSARTIVNQAGEPCLLTSESDPLNDATWLPFKTFVKGLSEVHPSSRKVLFLDCNETGMDSALGNPGIDFVEAAKRALSEGETRNLWVMFSHSPGERSWRTPDQGTSPFVTAIVHGLRNWNQADSQITLKELTGHVQSVTQEIVQDRLAATQTPLLVPENSTDFALAYWSKDQPTEQAVTENDSVIKRRLEDLRKLDEQLINSRGGINSSAGNFFAPALSEFLSRRRELETWVSAGLLSVPQADWESQILASQRVLKLLSEEPSSAPSPLFSLAEARTSPLIRADAVKSVVAFLSAPPVSPPPEMPPQIPDSSPLERTLAAWDWLLNQAQDQKTQSQKTLSQAQLKKALDLVPTGDQISPVEIQFARMLLHWGDWNSPDQQLIGQSAALAIICRDLAERATTFEDPRCFDPLRQELEAVAKERRRGEDLLYVGSLQTISQANDIFRQTSVHYQRLIEQKELIQKALLKRDVLLSWWLSVPATTVASFGSLGTDVDQALHLLDDRLNQESLRSDWLQEAVTSVEQSWTALQQEMTRRVNLIPRLRSEAPPDAPARRAILDLLENPLIEGFDRHNLRVKLARAEQRSQTPLHVGEGFAASPKNTGSPATDAVVSVSLSPSDIDKAMDRQLDWLQSLARSSGVTASPTTGLLYREQLNTAPEEFFKWIDFSPSSQNRSLSQVTSDLAKADRWLRVMAPQRIFSSDDLLRNRPELRLRALLESRLILWKTEQILEDYWGPEPNRSNTHSYFERMASQQLRTFPKASPFGDDIFLQPELKRCQDLLQQRISAVPGMLSATANNVEFLYDPSETFLGGASPSSGPVVSIQVEQKENPGQPAGVACIKAIGMIDSNDTFLLEKQLRRVAVPVGSSSITQTVPVSATPDQLTKQKGGRVTSFYRGHSRQSEFFAKAIAETSDDFRFSRPILHGRPGITLQGDRKQPIIMFVLDCSGSMNKSETAGETNAKRMDIAKRALRDVLGNLPDDQFLIGLMAYGHRYRYLEEDPTGRAIIRSSFVDSEWGNKPGETPVEEPNLDVQEILPPARVSTQQKRRFDAALNVLQPHGQTPLYRSMNQAMALLDVPRFAQHPKHVVIISDGMNETSERGPGHTHVLRLNVEEQLKQHPGVKIDIVGLGQDFNKAKTQFEMGEGNNAYADLKKLVELSKGEISFANDVSSLLDHLQRTLELVHFTVDFADDNAAPLESARKQYMLGQTWTVPESVRLPQRLKLTLHGPQQPLQETVEFHGDEQLVLTVETVTQNGRRVPALRFPRYGLNDDRSRATDVLRSPQGEEILVASHLPRPDRGSVLFRTSFQMIDGEKNRFSPRPALVVARITPLSISSGEQTELPSRMIYDVSFESGKPVPIAQFPFENWPKGSTQCLLDLFFSYRAISPAFESIVGEELHGRMQKIEELPDSNFQFFFTENEQGEGKLIVIETWKSDATSVAADSGNLRSLVQVSPPAKRVTRRYFQTSSKIRHEFDFDADDLRTGPRIQIRPWSSVEEKTLHLRHPFRVQVPVN